MGQCWLKTYKDSSPKIQSHVEPNINPYIRAFGVLPIWSGFCLHFPFALLFFTPTALLLFLLHTKVVSPSSCSFCPCPGMLASPDCHMTYSCLLLRSFRSQFRKALRAHGPPQPILTLFIFSTVFIEVSLAFAFIAFLPYQTVRFVRARTYL